MSIVVVLSIAGCDSAFDFFGLKDKASDSIAEETVASRMLDELMISLTGVTGRGMLARSVIFQNEAVTLRTALETELSQANIDSNSNVNTIAETLVIGMSDYISQSPTLIAANPGEILAVAGSSLIQAGTKDENIGALATGTTTNNFIASTASLLMEKAVAIDPSAAGPNVALVMQKVAEATIASEGVGDSSADIGIVLGGVVDAVVATISASYDEALTANVGGGLVAGIIAREDNTLVNTIGQAVMAAATPIMSPAVVQETMSACVTSIMQGTNAVNAGTFVEGLVAAVVSDCLTLNKPELVTNIGIGTAEAATVSSDAPMATAVLSGCIAAISDNADVGTIGTAMQGIMTIVETAQDTGSTIGAELGNAVTSAVSTQIEGEYTLSALAHDNPIYMAWSPNLQIFSDSLPSLMTRLYIGPDTLEGTQNAHDEIPAGDGIASIEQRVVQNNRIYMLIHWTQHPDPYSQDKWETLELLTYDSGNALFLASDLFVDRADAEALLGTDMTETAIVAFNLHRIP